METRGWTESVRVDPSPIWEAELRARLDREPLEPPVWVTELVDPRPAYYRRRVRVPPDRARRVRQAAGRTLHALIGSVLAAPGYLEVRARRDGVVGQIDLFDDAPTEIKTTESLPEPAALLDTRPSYVDQLAIYCALTDRAGGRLLLVESVDGRPARCQAYRARFRSPATLRDEVLRRAREFSAADAEDAVARLPRCGWVDRGCEFQAAGVCACTGAEPPLATGWRDGLEEFTPDPAAATELERRLEARRADPRPPAVERFRDLLYPRRAYFERQEPEPDDAAAPSAGAQVAAIPRSDLFRRLLDAIEDGPTGEASRVPVPGGTPLERVSLLAGHPFLLKSTRFPRPYAPGELLGRQPNYLLELGLRCAAVTDPHGWLIVGYERGATERDRLRVYEVTFAPLEPVARIATERTRALADALAEGDAASLPACPAWMAPGCPYGAVCGCAAAPGAPGP